MQPALPLNQIAFSVVDLRLTERWFREGCGLLPAGGARTMMRGPLAASIQGLPGAASTCWWLVGRNPWCQLELFQFERPLARLMPHDFLPCDIGYSRVGLWVADFDACLANLAILGSPPLGRILGTPGQRRACVRNPDGVYVELMEEDPLPQRPPGERLHCPAAIRSVTLSTPDLEQSVAYLSALCSKAPVGNFLHGPEHEALWGLAHAKTRSVLFEAGDVLLEVVQYQDPIGRPRPQDYRISDQGILNIAFGGRSKQQMMAAYERAVAFGAIANCRPVHLPLLQAGAVYLNDALGFSVELLWMGAAYANRSWGFEPKPLRRRPQPDTHQVHHRLHIAAAPERVWALIADHQRMSRWSGLQATRIRDGARELNGYGSERLIQGPAGIGSFIEQVTALSPVHSLRYRVSEGAPLVCHQGTVTLKPSTDGVELTWYIRFRPKLPGTGALLRLLLGRKLGAALQRLKTLCEPG